MVDTSVACEPWASIGLGGKSKLEHSSGRNTSHHITMHVLLDDGLAVGGYHRQWLDLLGFGG